MGLFSIGEGGKKTSNRTDASDNRVAVTDQASALVVRSIGSGKKSKTNVSLPGSIQLVGVGATLNQDITQTDFGAIQGATQLAGFALENQANLASAAIGAAASSDARLAELSTTKVTDGANLNQKTTVVAIAVLGAFAVLFLILRKH